MNEATLKAALVKALRKRIPGAVIFRHEDVRTSGIPDLSVSLSVSRLTATHRSAAHPPAQQRNATAVCWIEVKYRRPNVRYGLTPLQVRTLRHLGGLAVVYVRTAAGSRGHEIIDYGPEGLFRMSTTGWDHAGVAEFVSQRLGGE